MYTGLRISNTLHKKPCRIGWGLCGTSEKSTSTKFMNKPSARGRMGRNHAEGKRGGNAGTCEKKEPPRKKASAPLRAALPS